MKKNSLILNEEREMFILIGLFLFPIIPIVAFILSLKFLFLVLAILIMVLFFMMFLFYHCKIDFVDDKINFKGVCFSHVILVKDIAFLNKIKNVNYIKYSYYNIVLKDNSYLPKRLRKIKNSYFQKMIDNHEISILIHTNVIY